MKKYIVILLCFMTQVLAQTTTLTGIPLDKDWKVSLYQFAKENVNHPSWGLSHSERNYQLTKKLAQEEGITLDEDVLFAASLLHDLGGLPPYEKPDVDHAVRSAEIAGPILNQMGFPIQKLSKVQEMILAHAYYNPATGSEAAKLFRDADILDFLGTIGVARIFAITFEGNPSHPTLNTSVGILKKFLSTMSQKCVFHSSKKMAREREKELKEFLSSLEKSSFNGKAY